MGAPNTQGQKYLVGVVKWAPETSVSEEITDIFRNYTKDYYELPICEYHMNWKRIYFAVIHTLLINHEYLCFSVYAQKTIKLCTGSLGPFCKINIVAYWQQDKSEGFDSCDRPSNLTQIGLKLSIFQLVWPWNLMDDLKKNIGYLFYITSSFVYHLKPLHEFKLELLSRNAQFGSKSVFFLAVWPWHLTDDLDKQ